jgi:molecular chaperone HscB
MSQPADKALPAKCVHCDRPMNQPLLCDWCQTLHPVPSVLDHFGLLGLPRRFDVDLQLLHERYVALSRHSHPDFHANDPPEVLALSQSVSAAVNEAYRVLTDPVRRAGYLLELLGGLSSAQDKSVPDGFLPTMVMLQEELQEAKAAGKQGELERLGGVLRTQQAGLMNRVAGLFDQLDQAVACEATRQDLLHQIRRQLNAVAYVKKTLSLM